ncbi:hypothetical protein [Caldibacillus debilis]|uniref:Uncharacterized protein n=1 Tax=Caldibacillus debilis GB1 TaxID=1339248 RepID=A0A420VIN7_9BACI|nr:hypothetical protein [Caldibacillus debilis]RKO63233.1 hypothetical protein Cdeb_00325 [Caldibacillus debilis GB1]
MNITIEIKAPELANAIQALANAFAHQSFTPRNQPATEKAAPVQTPTQTAQHVPVQTVPAVAPIATPNQQQPAEQVTEQSVQQQQPAPQEQPKSVPTSTPSYTFDQLAVAATQLVDAGRREELVQLLHSFGVQALTALPKEQYGAFATKLREMGAKI